jgi:hypothetical protein
METKIKTTKRLNTPTVFFQGALDGVSSPAVTVGHFPTGEVPELIGKRLVDPLYGLDRQFFPGSCGFNLQCRQLRSGKNASKLSEENTVPFKSEAQRRYFEANKLKLKKQGVDVKEWEESSRGLKLPERAPKTKNNKSR